ncbi:glutathione synthetase, chloroplastic [Selaginella moellendorffii]|uniref:glutathione synthetase, chloroplastic n=1 Tax=Selaginella moellendorffii TaxID=88036 RepID=UPI000D1C8E4D|nr:glutathione synthetase, chloroplastic [Selaginella moellendorffii]|eukprot:XP_024516021.1 glutathione synthetase, chloroplastic [Selaginella moellendorffii]
MGILSQLSTTDQAMHPRRILPSWYMSVIRGYFFIFVLFRYKEWHARLLLERYKIPWISCHLAGTKKVQQELAKPNVLERNNKYGSAVKAKLLGDGGAGLSAYILMQRIFPPAYTSYPVRGGEWSAEKAVSELGIFSTYLQIANKDCGYLLRTKASKSWKGVAAGFAVLDSFLEINK